ncbi:SGNH/GDSL hydrolase family protein, partial [Streptomyces mirabilis]
PASPEPDSGPGPRAPPRRGDTRGTPPRGGFDAVVDFDRAARDPRQPARLLTAIDVGDHLHLNPAGYQLLADAVPARLFQLAPLPGDFGLE